MPVDLLKHADYPHAPGTLYECRACESGCYCDPQWEWLRCISCSSDFEQEEC